MARQLVFYRTTVGRSFRPERRGESPEVLVLTEYSFWNPLDQDILQRKLGELAQHLGYTRGGFQPTLEKPARVFSHEAQGIGFYRWAVVDEDDRERIRLGPRWIFTPSGEEKFWSDRPRETRRYIEEG